MLIFRRCIGSLINEEKITTLNNDTVRVRLEALKNENGENIYCFSYNRDENWIKAGEGEAAYLTTEVGENLQEIILPYMPVGTEKRI